MVKRAEMGRQKFVLPEPGYQGFESGREHLSKKEDKIGLNYPKQLNKVQRGDSSPRLQVEKRKKNFFKFTAKAPSTHAFFSLHFLGF